MTSPIDLAGFAAKFAGDDDPWRTFTARDEAVKRAAILHAIGHRPVGRVLELASGNGSNSAAIARMALRLDATEGTREGVDLTARAVAAQAAARQARQQLQDQEGLGEPGGFIGCGADNLSVLLAALYVCPEPVLAN